MDSMKSEDEVLLGVLVAVIGSSIIEEHYILLDGIKSEDEIVYPGDPVVIILATGSGIRGFKPGRGQ